MIHFNSLDWLLSIPAHVELGPLLLGSAVSTLSLTVGLLDRRRLRSDAANEARHDREMIAIRSLRDSIGHSLGGLEVNWRIEEEARRRAVDGRIFDIEARAATDRRRVREVIEDQAAIRFELIADRTTDRELDERVTWLENEAKLGIVSQDEGMGLYEPDEAIGWRNRPEVMD